MVPNLPVKAQALSEEEYESLNGPLRRQNEKSTQLVEKIARWMKSCRAAQTLSDICQKHLISAYFFGGVCRDCWNDKTPRDIDIVIDDAFWDPFIAQLKNIPKKTNRFGGTKFSLHGTEVDMWKTSNTWAFTQGLSQPQCASNLPETTFLNIESVVALIWHPEEPWVFQKGFFQAMETRTLEIQNPHTPDPALCLARAQRFLTTEYWKKGSSLEAFETYHRTHGVTEKDIINATNRHYHAK